MRIQHNIMAMNSYRNYTNNTSALSKNLEKLSSGYKINRAGDDAAGLAISEKMRAQITGLDAAQKNVKDGISLVKTAEGAMQEVHDMLNRMTYLATQSANGTYDNEVDRANLQKEVDSLKAEINRIADSANFNGINLLDGSMETKAASVEDVSIAGADRMLAATAGKDDVPALVAGSKTVLQGSGATATSTVFEVNLSELKVNVGAAVTSTAAATATVNMSVGDLKLQFAATNTATDATATVTAGAAATDATVMYQKDDGTYAALDGQTVEIEGTKYTAEVDTGTITFTMVGVPTTTEECSANYDVNITSVKTSGAATDTVLENANTVGAKVTTPGVAAGGATLANTVFKVTSDDIVDGAVITIGDKSAVLKVGNDSKTTSAAAETDYIVDLSGMEEGEIDLDLALSKISEQFAGNVTDFYVGANSEGITVQQKDTATAKFENGTDATEGLKYDTRKELGEVFSMEYTKNNAATSALTLQIGDTSDDYNQLTVSIGDMHTDALGIGDIDISTQEGAAAAVDKIKDAINYVSSIRGDLGATQNRLEHTANNLSVMEENIQDAESTIRDTDIAEEMMEYTKNNILIQSAQAMLAQANMVPQGVLQLLG